MYFIHIGLALYFVRNVYAMHLTAPPSSPNSLFLGFRKVCRMPLVPYTRMLSNASLDATRTALLCIEWWGDDSLAEGFNALMSTRYRTATPSCCVIMRDARQPRPTSQCVSSFVVQFKFKRTSILTVQVDPGQGRGLGTPAAANLMPGGGGGCDGLPAVARAYNLYHPYDPVAYRYPAPPFLSPCLAAPSPCVRYYMLEHV